MKTLLLAATAFVLAAVPASGHGQDLSAPCGDSRVPADARDICYSVAQAVEAAQPQLGILVAGGNPTLGTAGAGGLRLGLLPRVSATARLNLVFVRLPDILAEEAGGSVQGLNDAVGIPAPALSGTATVGVFPGFSLAPTIGGIGAVDLIGTATWLPFQAFGADDFGEATSEYAYSVGARLGIIGESFTLPGVSVSLMYNRIDEVAYGSVCDAASAERAASENGYTLDYGLCAGAGDAGEFAFDLTSWSGRAAIGKRFLGLGLTAGVGYDRYDSEIAFGFRAPENTIPEHSFVRVRDLELDNDRWSAFVDGSFSVLLATFAVEAGWLQGTDPLPGFEAGVDGFDPSDGTFFGSVGVRLGL